MPRRPLGHPARPISPAYAPLHTIRVQSTVPRVGRVAAEAFSQLPPRRCVWLVTADASSPLPKVGAGTDRQACRHYYLLGIHAPSSLYFLARYLSPQAPFLCERAGAAAITFHPYCKVAGGYQG